MSRYIAIRGQNREWLIIDTKLNHVIATSTGWNRSAELIVKALNAYDAPIAKLIGNTEIIDVEVK